MKTILFVDNHTEFLETRSAFLSRAGFRVLPASSLAQAEQILQGTWVHLALLDIRLEDDLDPDDDSGIRLAKNLAYRHIPKIMLTSHSSVDYVRQTMAPPAEGLPPAVDFLEKTESPQTMIEAADAAIAKHLKINWALTCQWTERCPYTFSSIAGLVSPSASYAAPADQAAEIEDLFRRLFYDSEQIAFDGLYWRQPGRVALGVLAFAAGKPIRHFLVTCGLLPAIEQERRNRAHLPIQAALPGQPMLIQTAQTLHFGANCFELPDGNLETAKTLAQFFQQNASKEVGSTLERLSATCLSPWHRQRRLNLPVDGAPRLFRQSLHLVAGDELEQEIAARIHHLAEQAASANLAVMILTPTQLQFQAPKGFRRTFPNPIPWLAGSVAGGPVPPIACGSSLNELSTKSILVDETGQPWLTDLGAVTDGPLLGDYAALETALKLDMLEDLFSLGDLYEIEELLLAVTRLTDRIEHGGQQVAKIVQAIQRIRFLAGEIYGNTIEVYQWALMFQALKRLLAYDPTSRRPRRELVPFVHACLCLGMLAERLAADQAAPVVATGLALDETRRQVYLDGRPVDLSLTDYEIFRYLWENAGRLCSREAIITTVYRHKYQAGKMANDDEKLNMAISRLRQKIEVEIDKPRFLVTKRGGGYILYPEGKPMPG